MDPMELPMDRFLNLVYYFATEDSPQDEIDKFDVKINLPDKRALKRPQTTETGPWSAEGEKAALSGFVASLGGGR